MSIMQWDESLSVNIKEIDNQHKILLDMTNELNQAMKERKGKEVLGNIIESLFEYAENHFILEEGYFDKYGYPLAAKHKMAHDTFIKKIKEFKDNFTDGKLMLSIEVMDFLRGWLIDHIKGEDQQYTEFFNQKGLI